MKENITVLYDGRSRQFQFEVRRNAYVEQTSEEMLSVPDLDGSTVVLYGNVSEHPFDGLMPAQVSIQTPRGQLVFFQDFRSLTPRSFISSASFSLTKKR